MHKISLVAVGAILLVGCGDKGDFEKAINKEISKEPVCYSLIQKKITVMLMKASVNPEFS